MLTQVQIEADNKLSENIGDALIDLFESMSVEDACAFFTSDIKRLNISSGEDGGYDYSND